MKTSAKLKRRFVLALLVLLIVFAAMVTASFAWYIYNTNARTTKVHMAAGTGMKLQISNTYDGEYGYAAVMKAFSGSLNPVSTDRITGGFQKVYGFTNGSETKSNLVANLFGPGEYSDYYVTTLYFRSNSDKHGVYLSDITYEDGEKPISTAIRVGFVVRTGQEAEYIFEINQDKNPEAEYNTAQGHSGCVLDSKRTDGGVVEFTPYNKDNFCIYDKDTGVTTLKDASLKLFDVEGDEEGDFGVPVRVDVYIWLEGCDEDCTRNLSGATLKNLALSFATN